MAGLLLADDLPIIRSTIARIVAREKTELYPIVEASNGEEAVELARRILPDIVLMDIKMPGMDGLQATAIIREELPATKIIILTAHDEFSYVQKALKLGAVDFLLKPVRPVKLIEVLNEVYGQLIAERRDLLEVAETEDLPAKDLAPSRIQPGGPIGAREVAWSGRRCGITQAVGENHLLAGRPRGKRRERRCHEPG